MNRYDWIIFLQKKNTWVPVSVSISVHISIKSFISVQTQSFLVFTTFGSRSVNSYVNPPIISLKYNSYPRWYYNLQ